MLLPCLVGVLSPPRPSKSPSWLVPPWLLMSSALQVFTSSPPTGAGWPDPLATSLVPSSSPCLVPTIGNSPSFGSDNVILPDTGCGLLLVLLPGSPPRWPTSPGWLSGPICSPPRWPVLHPRWELKLYILVHRLGGFQILTLTSSPLGGVVSFSWLTATVALPCASSLFHP